MSGDIMVLVGVGLHVTLQLSFALRALLRPHREAASRTSWILVILAMPALGMIAYVLFGETNIGRRRLARYRKTTGHVFRHVDPALLDGRFDAVGARHAHLFRIGQSVNGLGVVGGNAVEVLPDTNAAFERMVSDIDAATHSVHLLFYIWLEDGNGIRMAEAAIRAARRGVAVRAMADDIGSRRFIGSETWRAMAAAGVRLENALPARPLLLHPIRGRVDLRNHRKIVVIDNRVAYCGSANCADPEFRVKARFAPWVDQMLRLEGPVAAQMQYIFVQDWMAHADEDLTALVSDVDLSKVGQGPFAQVIATGPTVRPTAMPEVFEALIHASRRRLVITTPYYVPSDGIQSALCSAPRRGVDTTLILPRRNDSWIVSAASRSYYADLVAAGVRVFEFPHGLLHAKTLTLDGEIALVGSANLDRRSFELNYENNVLIEDAGVTAQIVRQQEGFAAASHLVDGAEVRSWPRRRRLWQNTVAMMGPIL
jgi:cardiolipin synthase